jgi:hypothetical protein
VRVLESLGVAGGGDVVEGTVLVGGGGKLALMPCKREEEKGMRVCMGERGSAGRVSGGGGVH